MQHVVEVDQSTKVEQSGTTILVFANGISHAILIPSSVKSVAFDVLRGRSTPNRVAYPLLFAAGLFILLRDHLNQLARVEIDVEYDGKDADIRSFLMEYIRKHGRTFDPEKIAFRRIGKKSPAHLKAAAIAERSDKNYRRVSLKEMLKVIG